MPHREPTPSAFVADIAARLRPTCSHLASAEFDRLVRDIAETKARFAAMDAREQEAASAAMRPLWGRTE